MSMFGYDRRPELFKEPKYPPPADAGKWLAWATEGAASGIELRNVFFRGSGLKSLSDRLAGAHAAPKVAELWAFETGRLP